MWASPNNGAENVKEMVGGLNSAILRYVGAPEIDPVTPYVKPTNMLREADLRVSLPHAYYCAKTNSDESPYTYSALTK
jgi:hypothetical protein